MDVAELYHGHSTPSERAVLSLVEAMDVSQSKSSSKVMCLVMMAEHAAHACLLPCRDMTRRHTVRENLVERPWNEGRRRAEANKRDYVLHNRPSEQSTCAAASHLEKEAIINGGLGW